MMSDIVVWIKRKEKKKTLTLICGSVTQQEFKSESKYGLILI